MFVVVLIVGDHGRDKDDVFKMTQKNNHDEVRGGSKFISLLEVLF